MAPYLLALQSVPGSHAGLSGSILGDFLYWDCGKRVFIAFPILAAPSGRIATPQHRQCIKVQIINSLI